MSEGIHVHWGLDYLRSKDILRKWNLIMEWDYWISGLRFKNLLIKEEIGEEIIYVLKFT